MSASVFKKLKCRSKFVKMLSECQTAWIWMRCRVTQHLIRIMAVCIWSTLVVIGGLSYVDVNEAWTFASDPFWLSYGTLFSLHLIADSSRLCGTTQYMDTDRETIDCKSCNSYCSSGYMEPHCKKICPCKYMYRRPEKALKMNFKWRYLCYFVFTISYVWPLVRIVLMWRF